LRSENPHQNHAKTRGYFGNRTRDDSDDPAYDIYDNEGNDNPNTYADGFPVINYRAADLCRIYVADIFIG
jgi:hypothetical protein